MSTAHGVSNNPPFPRHGLTSLPQSWHPRNLFNLWRRSSEEGDRYREGVFTNQERSLTLFQQRWTSKTLARAYHGDHVNEKIFKRWYVPSTLPDVRSRKTVSEASVGLKEWARKTSVAEQERKRIAEEEGKAMAPVGSLMFTEVERRMDVLVFRACLAHSVYEARRLIVHGDVMLNGNKVRVLLLSTRIC